MAGKPRRWSSLRGFDRGDRHAQSSAPSARGRAILESFPAFIVTEEAKQGLLESRVTGVDFAEAEVTTTDTFRELYPRRDVPSFHWLKPQGTAGQDDFGTASDGRLVISERALNVLRRFGAENALVEPFDG